MTLPEASIFGYSALIFATAFAGGVVPLVYKPHREDSLKIFVSVGVGLLLGMAFLHMLPEASEKIPDQFGFWFLTGFVLLLILERFMLVHPCEEHGCNYHTIGVTAFVGLTIHGVIEGAALASSFYVSNLGPLVLVAILAHKAPQGVALTSILKLAKKSTKQILLFNVGVALSGPIGALLAYYFLKMENIEDTAGILLAVSSGTFLYIGACDLLPELHRNNQEKFKRLFAFLVGLAIAYISGAFMEHH